MKTAELERDEVKRNVRARYGKIAEGSGCGCAPQACCAETRETPGRSHAADAISQKVGYSVADTQAVPEGANLGLGCGNPVAIASLKPGQTVVDLGSGAGFDAFLIARNTVIDHYRARKETVPVLEDLTAETESEPLEREELKASFRRMIFSLPDPYREALVLTEFDGMSQKALAKRLGISVSGAKSRVQRGRAQLKEMLDECCVFEFDPRGRVIDCHPRCKTGCLGPG